MGSVLEEGVGHRRHQQRQQQAQRLAPDDDDGDGAALLGAGAGADPERQHAGHQGQRRHQDRTEPVAVALHDRRRAVHAVRAQGVHVIDL